MSEQVSAWTRNKFGTLGADLRGRVVRAVMAAHASAADAQAVGNTSKQDPYGHTLKNTQHERLVAELRDLPGVEIRRLAGARYDLVGLREQRVTLYPLRYANDGHTARESVRIRLSAIRRDLLGGAEPVDPGQLTIEHAELTPEEIDEEFAAEEEIARELESLSSVVIIGYASSAQGVHKLGWGEGVLGEDGQLRWRYWEDLPMPGSAEDDGGIGDWVGPTPVSSQAGTGAGALGRFDEDASDDDLIVSARQGEVDAPQQEKPTETGMTGEGEGKE